MRCLCVYHRRQWLASEIGAANLGSLTGVITHEEWRARWLLLAKMHALVTL